MRIVRLILEALAAAVIIRRQVRDWRARRLYRGKW